MIPNLTVTKSDGDICTPNSLFIRLVTVVLI